MNKNRYYYLQKKLTKTESKLMIETDKLTTLAAVSDLLTKYRDSLKKEVKQGAKDNKVDDTVYRDYIKYETYLYNLQTLLKEHKVKTQEIMEDITSMKNELATLK